MRTPQRHVSIILAAVILTLSGCALDPTYNFDHTTIFKGRQAWENKRHADDWFIPLGDGLSVLGATFFVQGVESAINKALDRTTEPGWYYKKTHGSDDDP
jgi:hypothetical protein